MASGKRCETCYGYGHAFRECENECVYCRKHHKGGVCPVCPEFYPKADQEARAESLENIRARTAQEKQRLEEVRRELRQAEVLEEQIQAVRDEVAASAGGPIPKLPAGKNAALMALGKSADGRDATWRDIHPDWKNVYVQVALKAQWNAEALGQQAFAEDSMLKAALIRFGRWPVQRDANGFPIE